MIATTHGIGRNWFASVLARVWSGSVALAVDLSGLIRGGFSGRLSSKLLAQVDELHEVAAGDRFGTYKAVEVLKSQMTQEVRVINPKFGRQLDEYNSLRSPQPLLLSTELNRVWALGQ